MNAKTLPWQDVTLRPLDEIEVDKFKVWQNDANIRDRTMGFRFPAQTSNVAGWLEGKAAQNGRAAAFSIFFEKTGVGACFLDSIDWVNRTSDLGVYVGDRDMQGKGVGKVACLLLLDYAFNGLNLRRVGLEVVSFNEAAVQLYETLGFVREGAARQRYKINGKAHDVVYFGMLADEFAPDIPKTANRFVLHG